MSAIPVVIAQNGRGVPVKPVESGAPVMTVAESGLGAPIVVSSSGVPFVVEGLAPPTLFYVDPAGSDSNDGRSPGSAWQTLAKVNSSTFGAEEQVLFKGGETFSGQLVLREGQHYGLPGQPVTYGSYGIGKATIQTVDNAHSGVDALNPHDVTIRDLIVIGTGKTVSSAVGVKCINGLLGNSKLTGLRLLNLEVSQFGDTGIWLATSPDAEAALSASGWDGALIEGCVAHDCTGNAVIAGAAGIFVSGLWGLNKYPVSHTKDRVPSDVDLAPLFGQLSANEQDRAVQPAPPGRRKVVLATSIAETSLTIEGVRVVIDSGLARVPAYEPATGLTTLETRRVSRAAADQRRGRAGRAEPGVCFRLWGEAQTAALQAFDVPEILEADLSGLVLDLASWGVHDPGALAFLDPPPTPAWNEARSLLEALDALDADGRITTQGKLLARLPLHPRLAHMIAAAAEERQASTAAQLAALLTERGLGGDSTDIEARLSRLRTDSGSRAREARALAARWSKLAAAGSGSDGTSDIGRHLARAYPDRLAQAAGAPGRYRLANGRAATLDETDALARERYLVITDVTGTAANGRIRAAARIDRETIEDLFADRIVGETSLAFDRASASVRARRVRRLDALKLEETTVPVEDGEAAVTVLARGLAERGIGKLPWSKDQLALRARATYLHRQLGEPWPDLSDTALADDGAAWLVPHITGKIQAAVITAEDLSSALFELLSWERRTELERLLPSHFTAPTGSHLPIDYEAENGPALEVRVQELFGLDTHPSIAGGRIPLLLVLLSPAHRPIQTTRDLPGFWRGSWRDVAKDLKGRYPRHYWPDDPLTAQATSRAKPRGT